MRRVTIRVSDAGALIEKGYLAPGDRGDVNALQDATEAFLSGQDRQLECGGLRAGRQGLA